ncbi:MAG: hypothetical protein H6Q89_3792 [Myxococcaceae bacterium]|nr:hypothetical protein [Myxococcaceae bacterium]
MNATILIWTVLAAAQPVTASGSVTLPLAEALPLLAAREERAPRPPIDAVLVEQTLSGKPAQDGLIVDAHFVVEVLADRTWSQLTLLPLGPQVVVQQLESTEGATIAPRGGQLVFLSARAGRYAFDVRLLVRAKVDGADRSATLGAPVSAGVVPLSLAADPGIFELQGPEEVFPTDGQYLVRWRARTHLAQEHRREPPPPLEPRIKQLSASWVTTLEGRVTARLSYRLHLDRPQPFEVTVPEGQQLESVRVNGQVLPVTQKSGVLKLQVAPLRLGETEGTVELRLSQNIGVFHLAGALRVALPSSNWQTDAVALLTYLPAVFEYRRVGGSLEDGEVSEPGPSDLQLPGKQLKFRQYLVVASSPSVELRYSVDISKSYFR